MSTLKLETAVRKAGVNKPRSRLGLMWDRLTKSAGEPPFEELPEYRIRVVKIKPGTTEYPLRVKLKTIDPRKFKYTALSYTWDLDNSSQSDASYGPVGATKVIPCGGTNIKISQNLYDALCQYRDVQSDVPVFVDQLCINFDDDLERTEMLEIMGHIYSRAASVIVWLGKKSKDSDEIMLIMRKLVNAIDWRRMGDGGAYNFRDPRFFHNIGMEPLTLKQWRQVHAFCHMRWFTRYWSFFELALAKNALFLWGEACMEYNFLIDFGMILGLSGWLEDLRNQEGGQGAASNSLTKMLGPVARLRTIPPWHPKNPDHEHWMRENYLLETDQQRAWKFFEILMQSAEAFECRDARDKAFAPLAFVRQVYGGKPMNKQWLRPDYRKSTEEIIGAFSDLIYRNTGQPSILAGGLNTHLIYQDRHQEEQYPDSRPPSPPPQAPPHMSLQPQPQSQYSSQETLNREPARGRKRLSKQVRMPFS